MNHKVIAGVSAVFLTLVCSFERLSSLPIYRNMVSTRQGVLVNCMLCHSQDSWNLNRFGEDFMKEGRGFKALEILDLKDSDLDKVLTVKEWKAGSNPGDPASTPKRPGNWLKKAKATYPPKKILSPHFPTGVTYRVQEGRLPDAVSKHVEKVIAGKLRYEEKYPCLFWVEQDKKPVGLAGYSVSPSKDQAVNIFLVITDGEKILKVHAQKVHSKALGRKKFLGRFRNKTYKQVLEIEPLDHLKKESTDAIDSVARTLAVLNGVFQ